MLGAVTRQVRYRVFRPQYLGAVARLEARKACTQHLGTSLALSVWKAPVAMLSGSNRRWISTSSPLAASKGVVSSSSTRVLDMQFVDGACTLSVPLPLDGFDEQRVFRMSPDMTVADIATQLEAEDTSVRSVKICSIDGQPFKPDEKLDAVLADHFQLVINDQAMTVHAPVFTGSAYTTVMDHGQFDVRSVIQKAAIISLRQHLQAQSKWKISYQDFLHLCHERGIPRKQAREVLDAFHQAGIVFFFGQADDEELVQSVFLQPRNIIDAFARSMHFTPMSTQLLAQERDRLLHKISSLEPEHVALEKLHHELEGLATRHANILSFSMSTSLVGGFSLYFWLAFIHFSWDIMEPVTYFTGFGMSIAGYVWWSVTNQECEYENIYDYVFKRRLRKLETRAKFDRKHFEVLTTRLQHTRDRLGDVDKVLQKPLNLQSQYCHEVLELQPKILTNDHVEKTPTAESEQQKENTTM